MRIVRQEQLPLSVIAREFVGSDHGVDGISFLLVEAPPGSGPRLHKHDYDEIVLIQQGRGRFHAGDEVAELGPGEMLVIPSGTPHKFVNVGTETLRQIDIHAQSRFATEWLEPDGGTPD